MPDASPAASELRRAAVRGLLMGATLAVGFQLSFHRRAADPFHVAALLGWGGVGLALAVPSWLELRAARDGPPRRVPALGILLLIFATAGVGSLLALLQGMYLPTVLETASLRKGFVSVQDVAEALCLPYQRHDYWEHVLPWAVLWRWAESPRAPVETVLGIAAVVTIGAAGRWVEPPLFRAGVPTGFRLGLWFFQGIGVLCLSAFVLDDHPPARVTVESLQGVEEYVLHMSFRALLITAYGASAVLADVLERRLHGQGVPS